MLGDLAAQEDLLFPLAEAERTQLTHAPLADHLAGHVGGAFDVVTGTSCDVMHEDLFRNAATHQDGELRLEIFLVIAVLVVDRKLHRQAQRHAARDDRDLMERIGERSQRRHQCMAGFMERGITLLFVADDQALALHAHHHLIFGQLEIALGDHFAILPRRDQRGFVHQIRQIRARKTRRATRHHREVHIVRQRNSSWCGP